MCRPAHRQSASQPARQRVCECVNEPEPLFEPVRACSLLSYLCWRVYQLARHAHQIDPHAEPGENAVAVHEEEWARNRGWL